MTSAVKSLKIEGKIYVGRSCWPERRLLQHFRDHTRNRLAVLHWASSQHEAEEIEAAFTERLRGVKHLLVDGSAGGSWSGQWNCVYVSWNGELPVQGSSSVRQLDEGNRLWPEPWRDGRRPTLLHLSADITDRRAHWLLAPFEPERVHKRGKRRMAKARLATLMGATSP